MKNPMKFFLLLAAGMLVLGIPSMWPYGYYVLLRWVVASVAAYAAWQALERGETAWGAAFVISALIFNPIIPLYLSKGTWVLLDAVVAGVLASYVFAQKQSQEGKGESS